MASTSQFIGLAKSLPAPLQRFFARYPPAAILPENAPKTRCQEERPNPFRFYKHPVTGKWQDPVYSQRRQAELVKMARENGVEDLLPETRKGTEYKLAHRVEHGLRVKGTGVGQKVKGHIHERHMIAKYVDRLITATTEWLCAMPGVEQPWLTMLQDGDQEKGHVGNAQSHQALEEGMHITQAHGMASSQAMVVDSDTATHYQVLNLTPSLLDTQHDSTPLIKRAYHRALLRNHPDKIANSDPTSVSFTVDQITTALNILSNPSSRAAYDATLRVSRQNENRDGSYQTGVETIDLDDLAFDEDQECWYRSCRCGNEHSYEFREADLEEVSDEGELVVGCLGCSLWLRVHFAVMEDEQQSHTSNNMKDKS
ncbi:diphthamide biosynthesis 4 [Fusarium beomiforme]|uniref:Diphthamide biosynthesis protein 4 n=1 Tax=Fusarium beomiforme TaxID=44412 RepID=A0A9P5AGQ5_9HYPO|nr:diphthamide biosynthesis 4 [Fusarium beomiforme]